MSIFQKTKETTREILLMERLQDKGFFMIKTKGLFIKEASLKINLMV